MSLTPPLRNPGDDQPVMPRPRGPETGVYIARVYHGSETSVEAFVVSLNLKRRHLSEEQRAMVAGRLANLEEGRPEKTAQICAVSQSDAAVVQRDGAPELIAAVRDDYATACGLTRSRVGKNCRCTKVYCTTVLVKGTSGHLKHRGGGISFSGMFH